MTSHASESSGNSPGLQVEPDFVLPAQFLSSVPASALQPERRLMLAVMEDAVATFQKCALATHGGDALRRKEVEDWFASDDEQWPFSFRNICAALNLEPDVLRRGLAAWWRARRDGLTPSVTSSPFRRINGSRHKASGRAIGLDRLRQVA